MQELLEERTDTETGEISLTEEEFALVEEGKFILHAPNPQDLTEYVDKLGDTISKKLEQAKRYREQAERRAAPLEKTAEWLLLQLTPLVQELAAQKLPKRADGTFKSKTLNLPSCSFSFTKTGGPSIFDEKGALSWCREKGLYHFIKQSIEKADLMDFLKKSDGINEAPFIVNHKVDEFAKVKVKLD